ncbi:hypothetical protein Tco_0764546 [Tanacetum coccineum]
MKSGLFDGNKEVHKALNTNDLESFPSLSESCGSPISLTAKISAIEKQMIDGKLVLVGDDGLPLKPTHMEHSSSPYGFILENENGTDVVVESVVQTTPTSFASVVNDKSVNRKVNFRSFDSGKPPNDMAEVQISLSSVLEVHSRFEFSFYGCFLGKRVAFSVVEHYVKNAWKKYGIIRAMIVTPRKFPVSIPTHSGHLL